MINAIDKYSFIFSFIYTLAVAIISFLICKIIPKIKQYKIRKCLSLSKNECKIVLPCYDKKLHNKTDLIQVCPLEDIKAVSNIIDLIHATGLYSHQQTIIYENNYFTAFENYNIFCISKYLLNNYKDLYNRIKRKQHYFIAFKVKRSTGIIIQKILLI